ncbi:hypothetical protein [Phyllobacterium bourgognense]|uniref:hypothetical protein n=1 Tax=Phyllobacterium bourgognense TaxID=314236 RepID=UPI0011C034F5|nr:hypothetical protein [Phyllobacterium bourgognense]
MKQNNNVLFGIQNEANDAQISENELADLIDAISKIMYDNAGYVRISEMENSDGFVYYLSEDECILLKTNMFGRETLEEEEYPDFAYLLYLYNVDKHPEYLAAIETRPDIFVKLRTE